MATPPCRNQLMTIKKFTLSAIPPFRLNLTVWALRRRTNNIIDQWDGRHYTRIIVFNNKPIKVRVTQNETSNDLEVVITLHGKQKITAQLQKEAHLLIQEMLGLTIDLRPFYALVNNDATLQSLVKQFSGLKPPRFPSVFEGLINSIACQQVSLDVGLLMLNRLAENFGTKFVDSDSAFYAFPGPKDLAEVREEDIKKLGFSYQKARAIKELATSALNKTIDLANLEEMTNNEIVAHLSMIRGIGRWSAEYVLLRGLGRLDAFPGDDIGAQNNLKRIFLLDNKPTYEGIKKLTSRWHPYEGLVYFHLLLEKLHLKKVI